MSDAAWAALAAMVASVCSLLAAVWAKQGRDNSLLNSQKLEAHEEADSERVEGLRETLAPGAPAAEESLATPGAVLQGVDSRLLQFARRNNLKITSARDGRHNVGSKHGRGKAIDFRTRGLSEEFWQHLARDAYQHQLKLRDERVRPLGQKVWSGPHGHCETLD